MITSSADLRLELGVRVDGDAAAVVGHGEEAVGLQLHLDPGGVAGHRLVHGVVDHLGEQVVQRLLVGAADVHAGAAPHRLQAFQHLDVGGRIALGRFGRLADGTRHFLFHLLLHVLDSLYVLNSLWLDLVRCVRLHFLFGTLRVGGFHGGRHRLWGRWIPAAARAASCKTSSLGRGSSGLPRLESSDSPNRSRKRAQTESCHGLLARCWRS